MSGCRDIQHIARKLEDRMLASATSTKKRTALLTRETNDAKRALHGTVWAGRNTPESSVGAQLGVQRSFGIDPFRLYVGAIGSQRQSLRNSLMCENAGVVITD